MITECNFVTDVVLNYTSPAQYGGAVAASTKGVVKEVRLTNSHTIAVGVDLYFVPSGGSVSSTNQELVGSGSGCVLGAGETRTFPMKAVLLAGATIWAAATVVGKIAMRVSGYTIP